MKFLSRLWRKLKESGRITLECLTTVATVEVQWKMLFNCFRLKRVTTSQHLVQPPSRVFHNHEHVNIENENEVIPETLLEIEGPIHKVVATLEVLPLLEDYVPHVVAREQYLDRVVL